MIDYSVISSRVRLARNLSGVKFPSKITPEEVVIVEKAARAAAKEVFDTPRFYRIADLDAAERAYLVEGHYISPMLLESPFASLILSEDGKQSVMLEEEDHIRSQCIESGLALEDCFEKVKEYDFALRGKARLAYDKQLGFLTACPTNVGTGMRASVMMFLPAISAMGKIEDLEEELKSANLTIRGALGEGSKGEGYCYQISNAVSLGVTEETILNRVGTAADRIKEIEGKMLDLYYQRNRLQLEDSVARSYALLCSAKLLPQQELESLLVNVKIGIMLGLITINTVNLDELALLCKPSSLIRLTKCSGDRTELDATRAETVRKAITKKEK